MTIYDFIALTNDEQLDTVGAMGVFLSRRKDRKHQVTLYQLDDFYVEVYFNLTELRISMLSAIQGDYPPGYYEADEPLPGNKPELERFHNPSFLVPGFPSHYGSSLS